MDAGNNPLPNNINPSTFPAKLWYLVNNPAYESIQWDSQGEVIMINSVLFEREILSPGIVPSDNICRFKTTNYSSFVRQLNLYGFKKANLDNIQQALVDSRLYKCFYNPNFKQNHPELIVSLRRLTADRKAKLQAGVDLSCQLLKQCRRLDEAGESGDKNLKRRISSLLSLTPQQSPHLNKTQAMKAHTGTPAPPQYLMRQDGAGLPPIVFSTVSEMPASLSHHYNRVPPNSSLMNVQQGLLTYVNHGNPKSSSFPPRNAQCQHGYCPAVCPCYYPNLVSQHTELFATQKYLDSQHKENTEGKKCAIDLDTVFQIADEIPLFPNTCLVKIESPEKLRPVSGPSVNNGTHSQL